MKAQVVKALSGYLSAAQRLFGTASRTRSGITHNRDAFARWLREFGEQNRAETLRKLRTRYARS
jgi:hypothetical protein